MRYAPLKKCIVCLFLLFAGAAFLAGLFAFEVTVLKVTGVMP